MVHPKEQIATCQSYYELDTEPVERIRTNSWPKTETLPTISKTCLKEAAHT